MNVFITGLNGFIARHLGAWLADRGHSVRGTSRAAAGRAFAWRLTDPPDPAMLEGMDVVIHAAHDFTPGAMKANVEGTIALERAAVGRRQILVSSLSARPDAVSEYGRTKLAQEAHFLARGHTVIRPGTVLGRGGLFGKMAGMMEKLPVLPLLDGGRARMTVIGVHDLCRAVEEILRRPAGEFNLYYEEKPTLGELLGRLREILGRKTIFVPVPAALLLLPLSLLRALQVRTPVDVDNLKGYMKSLEPVHASTLLRVLPRPASTREALAEAYGLTR